MSIAYNTDTLIFFLMWFLNLSYQVLRLNFFLTTPAGFQYVLMCTIMYQLSQTQYMSVISYLGISGGPGTVRITVGLDLKAVSQLK